MTIPSTSAHLPKAASSPWEKYGWLMAVVWMFFLIYPVLGLLASEAEPAWRILGWAATVTFAALYIVGFTLGMRGGWRRPSRTVIVLFWAIAACAVATVPAIETQALSFLPFILSYASYGLGGRWHWIVSALGITIAVVVTVASGRVQAHLQLLIVLLVLTVVNTINTWLISRSVAADEIRVQLATSEERTSVARDVHDLLGHSLTVVKLKAELASRLIDRDPRAAKAEIDEIVRITSESIANVRSTVTELRATDLADQLAASASALETMGVRVTVTGSASALSPAQALPAAWILREATTNVLRHADASTVRIELSPGTLLVEDDGGGVHEEPGNGLRGMAERATAAGAALRVEPRATGGTRVSLTW